MRGVAKRELGETLTHCRLSRCETGIHNLCPFSVLCASPFQKLDPLAGQTAGRVQQFSVSIPTTMRHDHFFFSASKKPQSNTREDRGY
jgi:hypothetical protein